MKVSVYKRVSAFGLMLACAGVFHAISASDSLTSSASSDSHLLDVEAGVMANAGEGDFAPYFISANRHGVVTGSRGLQIYACAHHDMDSARRFSYGYGVSLYGGCQSEAGYLRYNDNLNDLVSESRRPSCFTLQELYAQVKYRGVEMTVGLKERESVLFNPRLGSGDFIESGNARPVPQIRVGFIDYRNIPFTGGWVQIRGNVGYGFMTDNGWWRDHFNYYTGHVACNERYMYRSIHFRTMPSQPLSVTVGAQSSANFGGSTRYYFNGTFSYERHRPGGLMECLKIFFPFGQNEEDYYIGNTIGSWDFSARLRFRKGHQLKAYFQWPWEDGSGIGKLNGFDGIWGVEFNPSGISWLKGIVAEYIDFTNQSGPIHWAPGDFKDPTLTSHATGADDYYNNKVYNSYANYGLVIGTPFIMSPIFNTDGQIQCLNNRVRGFHVGVEGEISSVLSYRALLNYRKSFGSGFFTYYSPLHQTSAMAECRWKIRRVSGLHISGAVAIDRGKLPSNSFGAMVTVSYNGRFNLKH